VRLTAALIVLPPRKRPDLEKSRRVGAVHYEVNLKHNQLSLLAFGLMAALAGFASASSWFPLWLRAVLLMLAGEAGFVGGPAHTRRRGRFRRRRMPPSHR